MSGREKAQRSRSAKYPLARHCSFDFRRVRATPALHKVLMQVKWDGAIREARRKSRPVEMRVVKRGTPQRAPDFGHTHKREGG